LINRPFFFTTAALIGIFLSISFCYSQETTIGQSYQITSVEYDIKGSTRLFPLTKAVPIDQKKIFPDKIKFDAYIKDIELQFQNQRVFESTKIDTEFSEAGNNSIVSVKLIIHTVDTWNIIVLPKPGFDSNKGFELKLKLKNYNFLGSMQVLDGDLSYTLDNQQKSEFSTNLNFNIPFSYKGYALSWNNELSATFPLNEKPEYNFKTGLNIEIPIAFTKIVFGFDQALIINDRNATALYLDDPYYFQERMYSRIPITLVKFSQIGDLVWAPETAIRTNLAVGGIHHSDLQGPEVTWGHSLSLGRVNWFGNFRQGFNSSLSNSYTYNFFTKNQISTRIDGTVTGYSSFFDRFGIYSQLIGFYNFNNSISSSIGNSIRGILNDRISSDTAFSLNLDLPVKVLHADFLEATGVKWTRLIGFEAQLSPFFDMMLTHDTVTGRYYSFKDGWYSGGFEIIIYPVKMRSLYARISAGYDLEEMIKNGGKLPDRAERDGCLTHEYFFGLGLQY